MKYIGENAIKKLISLIKGDLATKQPTITATGVLERDTTGVINGVETVGATLVETQEATLVDVPNGLLKGDGTTISAAVAGTDYVNSNQAIRYDAAQTLTDAQKQQARGNINAAPGGFGLGTISQVVTDFDTVKMNGWYYGAAGTAHAPNSENSWSVLVTNLANNSEVCIQDAYTLINVNRYLHCRRLVYVSTATQNNPWEWVNPPMQLGVEYRTTERYSGKPVYTKLITFEALTGRDYLYIYGQEGYAIRASGEVRDPENQTYWMIITQKPGELSSSAVPMIAFDNFYSTCVGVICNTNSAFIGQPARVQVWYYKPAD